MSEFYITLPSNACMNTFPDNSLTNYVIKLDRPLRLEKNWVVGLVEMHYPNSWDNVNDGSVYLFQRNPKSVKLMRLKPGRYRTIKDVTSAVHRCLSSFGIEKTLSIVHDEIQNFCFVRVADADLQIQLSENLCNILGLENKKYEFGESRGIRQCDIAEGFTSLYVYSNIVQPQIVGDVQVPLLRIVPVKEKSKETNQVERFQHVQYLPINNMGTETIEVVIKRDNGIPPSFRSGKVIITLHLKQTN